MVSDFELLGIFGAVTSIAYAALWLGIAGLGLWRVRVAFVPSAMLIAAGMFGATAQFLWPLARVASYVVASGGSSDTAMYATLIVSSVLSILGTLPWIVLLLAIWRLLLALPAPPEAP